VLDTGKLVGQVYRMPDNQQQNTLMLHVTTKTMLMKMDRWHSGTPRYNKTTKGAAMMTEGIYDGKKKEVKMEEKIPRQPQPITNLSIIHSLLCRISKYSLFCRPNGYLAIKASKCSMCQLWHIAYLLPVSSWSMAISLIWL